MNISLTLRKVLALAASAVAAVCVAFSAICAVVMIARLRYSASFFLPPFSEVNDSTLVFAFVIACGIAYSCHRLVRKVLGAEALRDLFSKV